MIERPTCCGHRMWLDINWRRALSRKFDCAYCGDVVVALKEELTGPTRRYEAPPKKPWAACEVSLDGGATWEETRLDR